MASGQSVCMPTAAEMVQETFAGSDEDVAACVHPLALSVLWLSLIAKAVLWASVQV